MVVVYATVEHIQCQVDSHIDENPVLLLTVLLRMVLPRIAKYFWRSRYSLLHSKWAMKVPLSCEKPSERQPHTTL